jgi:acyl-CoA thioester hydrolase
MSRLTVSDFTVKITLPVQWGDMDAANHVNNAVYIRWVESARLAYFVEMGMDTTFRGADAGPILAWQDCKYIFPVTFPDTVTISDGMRYFLGTTRPAGGHCQAGDCAV